MKTIRNSLRLLAVLGFTLILSSDIFAQNNRIGRYHRYGNYYGSRPHVSIGIGISPYYYHPFSRPRIYYRPPYRPPYRYGHYGPVFGLRINVLPFGYSRFYLGGRPYYYYDGIYYRPCQGGGYTVSKPPLGAMVKHLPAGAKVTVIDGQKYYELGGTFYQERISAKNKARYEVVGTDGVLNTTNLETDNAYDSQAPSVGGNNTATPNEGSMAKELPAGSTGLFIGRQKYYLSPAGVYYEEVIDGNNNVSYKVAGSTESGMGAGAETNATQ